MVQQWQVYWLQLLLGCGFAVGLVLLRWIIQKKNHPQVDRSGKPCSHSFRFHYHLGFVLSFGFLTVALMLLPLVESLGRSGVDQVIRSRAFFSLILSVFFLLLAISYGVKKGDFKWKRPD